MGQVERLFPAPWLEGSRGARTRVSLRFQQSRAGRYFLRSEFVRSVVILAGGTAIGQIMLIVSSPLLTRMYRPADFGVLAVFVSLLSFLLGIASWRYQMAIPLADSQEGVVSLLILCLGILVLMTGLMGLVLVLFGSHIVRWTNAPDLGHYLWLLPISFLGAGGFQILTSWAIRNGEFAALARTRIGQSVGQVGSQLVIGLLTTGAIGLLLGDAVGRATGTTGLARQAWRQLREHAPAVGVREIAHIANRYRRFPLISAGSGLITSAGFQLPLLLVASFYGPAVVGWFALCQRLISMSFVLVASSVGTVYLGEAARVAQIHPDRLMHLFWATVSRSFLIAIGIATMISIAAPFTFGTIFGEQWTDAGRYAQVLAVAACFQFVNRAIGSTGTILERQELDLVGDVFWIVCGCGGLLLGNSLNVSPLACIALFSAGTSLGATLSLALSWYAIRSSQQAHARQVAQETIQ